MNVECRHRQVTETGKNKTKEEPYRANQKKTQQHITKQYKIILDISRPTSIFRHLSISCS